MITDGGVLIRTRSDEISIQGRNTQGVRVIALSENEHLVTVDRVDETESDEIIDDESEEFEAALNESESADEAVGTDEVISTVDEEQNTGSDDS